MLTQGNIRELVMKKVMLAVSAATLFGFSATSIAATPSFFVGAQLGHQDTAFDMSTSYTGTTYSEGIEGLSISGIAGGLFVGAKYPVGESFYLGTEVNVGTSAADHTTSYGTDTVEVEAGTSYGIAALAGKQITPSTSIYGRLGYQRTKYELTYSGPGYSESDDDTFGGVRVGVGMETSLARILHQA